MCACVGGDSFDTNSDKFIDFDELKRMMEKVGSPQTHLALKAMIREVDEDGDNRISFREVGICILFSSLFSSLTKLMLVIHQDALCRVRVKPTDNWRINGSIDARHREAIPCDSSTTSARERF